MHSPCGLHEICCYLVYALLVRTDHVHDKNPGTYLGIIFAPVCLFEIVLICSAHSTSEIDGSRNLSVRGLNLEQIFACRYRY